MCVCSRRVESSCDSIFARQQTHPELLRDSSSLGSGRRCYTSSTHFWAASLCLQMCQSPRSLAPSASPSASRLPISSFSAAFSSFSLTYLLVSSSFAYSAPRDNRQQTARYDPLVPYRFTDFQHVHSPNPTSAARPSLNNALSCSQLCIPGCVLCPTRPHPERQ
jgi:hypothetical protein